MHTPCPWLCSFPNTFAAAAEIAPVLSAAMQPVLALQGKELGKSEAASSRSDTAAQRGWLTRGPLSADAACLTTRCPAQGSQAEFSGAAEYEAPRQSLPWGAATPDLQVCVKQSVLAGPKRPQQRDSSSSPSERKGPVFFISHHSPRQEPNGTGTKQDTRGNTGKKQHLDYQEKCHPLVNPASSG